MAAFGLQPQQAQAEETLSIWPENWAAFDVFEYMLTQLHVTPMGSVSGLRYESMPFVLRILQIPRAEQRTLMDSIRIMERHMLKLLAKRK